MAATLSGAPPGLGYTQSPIFVELETDNIEVDVYPKITITLTGSGPVEDETLEITWLGATHTFTFKDAPATAFELPTIGAGTLITVADAIAAAFRECEVITDEWDVTRETGGVPEYVYLTYRLRQHIGVDATTTATGTAAAEVDIADPGPALVPNLRALLQVWHDTGDVTTDVPLLKQHSPYDLRDATAIIDIAPAFAELAPSLPDRTSINPAVPAFVPELTEGNYRKYFLRYADKYGAPPVSDKMTKSGSSYLAILGSRAMDSLSTSVNRVMHNYQRRDGETFRKPVSDTQPDWVYWLANNALQHRVSLLLYWSDGTTSTYLPFPGTTFTPVQDKCYWMPSGYMQLKIDQAPQEIGTDADATIIAYDFRLERTASLGTYTVTVRYDVDPYCSDFGLFLLMSNGQGGCESVRMKGKKSQLYETASETYKKSQWMMPGHDTIADVSEGTIELLTASGSPAFEVSTGWYEDSFYLEHLQQLALTHCWIIDMVNKRFMRVIVEGKQLASKRDDDTMFAMSFTLRAAWEDTNWTY